MAEQSYERQHFWLSFLSLPCLLTSRNNESVALTWIRSEIKLRGIQWCSKTGAPLYYCLPHTPLCLCGSLWDGGALAPQAADFQMLSRSHCGANCDCYAMPRLSSSVQITSSTAFCHLVGSNLHFIHIWTDSKKHYHQPYSVVLSHLSPSHCLYLEANLDVIMGIIILQNISTHQTHVSSSLTVKPLLKSTRDEIDEIWLRWWGFIAWQTMTSI